MDQIFIITAEEFETKQQQYAMYASSDIDYTGRKVYFASESVLDRNKSYVSDLIRQQLEANGVIYNCRRDDIFFKNA